MVTYALTIFPRSDAHAHLRIVASSISSPAHARTEINSSPPSIRGPFSGMRTTAFSSPVEKVTRWRYSLACIVETDKKLCCSGGKGGHSEEKVWLRGAAPSLDPLRRAPRPMEPAEMFSGPPSNSRPLE